MGRPVYFIPHTDESCELSVQKKNNFITVLYLVCASLSLPHSICIVAKEPEPLDSKGVQQVSSGKGAELAGGNPAEILIGCGFGGFFPSPDTGYFFLLV